MPITAIRTHSRRGLGVLLFAGWICLSLATGRAEDFATARLRGMNIDPTPGGVESYMRSLIVSEESERRVEKLIAQLGSGDIAERQAAMAHLLELPVPPVRQIEAATQSPNPEIRARAKRLLIKASPKEYKARLVAVLNFIEQHEVKGMAAVLVELLPQIEDGYVLHNAERVLRVTVDKADADLVRREMAVQPSPVREILLLGLGAALGAEARPELLPLLEHKEPAMRLAAAEALADLGERRSLPVLIDLLDAEDVKHRQRSAMVLRAVTNQHFSYSATLEAKARGPAVRAWRNWWTELGETAELTYPFPRHPVEVGRTLVCVWASNFFKEVDATKSDVFGVPGFKYVWGCHGTPDGRRLVVDAERQAVFEYDGSGWQTWQRTDLPGRPTSVEGLDNGNVLVACSDSNRVVEIARDGRIVWDYTIEGRPTTAQRLKNGNTVINLQTAGEVVEVDQQGNRATLLKGLDRPHTSQRLDNGNILVTEMRLNRVDEYDVKGNIVWSKTNLKNPAQSQRIANGNTLIADEDGIQEIAPDGTQVWHLEVTRSRFFRY